MKPYRQAIALIFYNDNKVLTVKRSGLSDSFPNFWSLPSTWLAEGETTLQAAQRLTQRKLGLHSIHVAQKPVGHSEADRGTYILQMSDYEVIEPYGDIRLNPEIYVDMRWVTPQELKKVIDKEHNGVMGECCRAFLQSKGL